VISTKSALPGRPKTVRRSTCYRPIQRWRWRGPPL